MSEDARKAPASSSEAAKGLSFYEQVGIVIPGAALLLFGLGVLPATRAAFRTRFQYDAVHVNALLRDAHNRLGVRGKYVGEWHTHIEPDPHPSPTDIESLSDIALAPNFLADEPILLIAGVDPQTGRVAKVHASSFPMNRAMQTVPLQGL